MTADNRPLIAHVIQHFITGGMENGIVNLINHMPEDRYRHAIISLSHSNEFTKRIQRRDVMMFDLHKQPGQDFALYGRLFKTFRAIKPAIVHTRNLAALEAQLVAKAAGVQARIHGEHGRDICDLHGKNLKYNLLRRAVRPFVSRYISVSQDLARWLSNTVGVPAKKIEQIYNGVDSVRFYPGTGPRHIVGARFADIDESVVIGSVGRMVDVKDYPTLIHAFAHLKRIAPLVAVKLVIIGDGPSRPTCERLVAELGLTSQVWLAGDRSDVPELMRALDVFVLPSLGEGISNTILEAMASGLPVVATAVGGNPELVSPGKTGTLVPPAEPEKMAQALLTYVSNPERMAQEGQAARAEVEARFSMEAMVDAYLAVYDQVLKTSTKKNLCAA